MEIRKYLPSKNFTAIILLPTLVFFGLVFYFNFWEKKYDSYLIKSEKKNNLLTTKSKDIDSDGDGLMDWEEQLIGTDIHKKDTDGDGIDDNIEVKLGTNPKSKVEKGIAILNQFEYKKNKILNTDNINTTKLISYKLINEGLKLNKSGMVNNQNAQQQAVNKILQAGLSKLKPIKIEYHKYTLSNLNINIDYDNIDDFRKSILKITSKYKNNNKNEDPTMLWAESLTTGQKIDKNKVLKEINRRENMLQELLEITVPKDISKEYLDFINSLNAEIDSTKLYLKDNSDPINGIYTISIVKKVDQNFINSLNKLKNKIITLIKNNK